MDLDLLWYRGDSVNRSGRDTGGRIDGLWTLDTGLWILDTKLWRRTFSARWRRGARPSWEMLQGYGIGASRRKAFALYCSRVVQLTVCRLKVDVFEHRCPSPLFWSSRADQRAVDLT